MVQVISHAVEFMNEVRVIAIVLNLVEILCFRFLKLNYWHFKLAFFRIIPSDFSKKRVFL
jgi:hypothetical protein